jgi:hypothetical protein
LPNTQIISPIPQQTTPTTPIAVKMRPNQWY